MKTDDIREKFLEFYRQKGHKIEKSDSLIPSRDPSLLFTSAGMVQFKQMYLAEGDLPYTRAATSQKCFRTSDVENVGRTARHQTFFEMLGNFSFGDYFKQEVIPWEWELITEVFNIPREKLWVSFYEEDKETFEIWHKKIGLPEERLKPFGKEDNYWPSGDGIKTWIGACGPCTEIFIDHGPEKSCGKPTCAPGCDCDRYEEFMNIVLPQFYHTEKGEFAPLAKRGVDMGAGLERIASILQDVPNNFEIDTLRPILDEVAERANVQYGSNPKNDVSLKLITDHVRAVCFLVGDGILPGNEGRGYVLRRLIRRAVRHGKLLGLDKPFLYRLAGQVGQQMKKPYPEILERREHISQVLLNEEERFFHTLTQGMELMLGVVERVKKGSKKIDGRDAFRLYDTFGFPLELTEEIAAEEGLEVDRAGFEACLEEQRTRARSAWAGSGEQAVSTLYVSMAKKLGPTKFVGYESVTAPAKVLALVADGKELRSADADQEIEIMLDTTPFYAAGGGQAGDKGVLVNDGAKIEVTDTIRVGGTLIVHKARIIRGGVKVGDAVTAEVEQSGRHATARNHTGTHLLQSALRHVLGKHVEQAGSLVEPERLRFDFTHFAPVTVQEIRRIEEIVNENIRKNLAITKVETTMEEAKKLGALAFFGEKYGERVRVVSIAGVSTELCGGTHLDAAGQIGFFKILSEGGVAAGVRRIEAVTGEAAYRHVLAQDETLKEAAALLKTGPEELIPGLKKMLENQKRLEKELAQLRSRAASGQVEDLLAKATEVKGVKVLAATVEGATADTLREMTDHLKEKIGSGAIVLGTASEGRVIWVAAVTKDLTGRLSASDLVKKVAAVTGGGGGGRPDFAQAGGKQADKMGEAVQKAGEIAGELIK